MRRIIMLIFCGLCLMNASSVEARKVRHTKQTKQNNAADKYHLTRIKNLTQLKKFIKKKWLVLVSDTDAYQLDEGIGELDPKHKTLYHYARSYVKDFLDTELAMCHKEKEDVFEVYSLVRTLAYQILLNAETDGAIIGKGWKQSAHLTGAAVDIYSKGLSAEGKSCLRKRLRELENDGEIIAMRESGHFHVMVLPSYGK